MRWLFLMLAIAGCGDDNIDPASCQPDGFAEVGGTVGGATLGPFARAEVIRVDAMYALAFDEVAGACGTTATTGQHLVMLLCDPPEAKNYRLVARQGFRCPGNEALAVIERDGGTDVGQSTGGTLMIDRAEGCVSGTYSIQVGPDVLDGSFDAVTCE